MSSHSKSRAFSLVELIFVIVSIGLLLAVAQPSLQSALQLSRKTICLNRLHAIGQASIIYSNADPNDIAIPIHPAHNSQESMQRGRYVGAYDWGGKSGIGWEDYLGWGNDPIYSAYGTLAGFGPATRPLNAVIYKGGFVNYAPGEFEYDRPGTQRDMIANLEAFRCPADDGPPLAAHCPDWVNNPLRSSYDHFGTSFAANLFMIGSGGSGPIYSNSPYLRALSDIRDPNRTITYEENIGRWAWAARSELRDCYDTVGGPGVDPGPTKAIRGWHGKNWTFNRAFADDHAETQPVYIEGTEDSLGYANHYRREYIEDLPQYPNDPDLMTNEDLNQRYQCIIVRGDGWQKDTFPAELLHTGLVRSGPNRPSYENCVEPADALLDRIVPE